MIARSSASVSARSSVSDVAVVVLDSSALLACIFGEPGAREVARQLHGAHMGAANWSESLVKMRTSLERESLSALALQLGLVVDDVTRVDAERAAELHATSPSLSLGDRLCLALAERLDAEVLTADKAWGSDGRIRQIR